MPRGEPVVGIFDFDGTIADSLETTVSAYNRVAPWLGVRAVASESLPRLRELGARALLREHEIQMWKLPLVVQAVRHALRGVAASLPAVAGMPEVLRALQRAGCRTWIVSTNATPNIERFLARHQLRGFERVVGGVSVFGKARALARLLAASDVDRTAAYYVGDEVRDLRAAARAGVKSVAVSWGYAARASLAAAHPDHLVDHPEELLPLLGGGAAPGA